MTEIPLCVPVIEGVAVSVPVMDCVPTVFSVTANARAPASAATNVLAAGRAACASVELNETVPRYPVAVFPKVSSAVTVTLPAAPAVIGDTSPATESDTALADVTEMPECVPTIDGVSVSAALRLCVPAVLNTMPETVAEPKSAGTNV